MGEFLALSCWGMVGEGDPLECYTFACELTVSKLLNFPLMLMPLVKVTAEKREYFHFTTRWC